ncbi:TadE/TadG family type IV pilus assembly protein [Citreimonas sp.]|uniref:TadE/TadG family type IV pilus assembly protein n=1 Tax=Citreimonas sp. TaxID=3036715 RepID=UPI0035C825CE
MIDLTAALIRRLRAFGRDERGVISIEFVIWMPLILAVMASTFTLFEAFRQKSLNIKAAYTISDAISRETDPIDAAYLDGMLSVLRFLADSDGSYGLRVTLVRYDANSDTHEVGWSQARGEFVTMDDDMLAGLRDRLPALLHNERVIVVETETEHTPVFEIPALQPQSFYNFVFTRPRFAPQIVWAG